MMSGYVTGQPGLKFYRDGEVVTLPLGAPVPEAQELPNFAAMCRIGQLIFRDKGGSDPVQQAHSRQIAKDAKAQEELLATDSGPLPHKEQEAIHQRVNAQSKARTQAEHQKGKAKKH